MYVGLKMKSKLIIGLLIVSVFLLAGCNVNTGEVVKEVREQLTQEDINKVITCNPPYIRYGAECCLDQNKNSICDNDENIVPKPQWSCSDTDRGSIYEKGTIKGTSNDGQEFGSMTDYCSNEDYLKEYECDSKVTAGWVSGLVLCDYGCSNGACKETYIPPVTPLPIGMY